MTEHNEAGEQELSTESSIVFASEDALEQARKQLSEYEEHEGTYKGESPQVQVGFYGPERLVGMFKTAIMKFAIDHAEANGYQSPIALADVLRECRETTRFKIFGAEEVHYVTNPRTGSDDKERLPYCPDFDAITEIDDLETYAEVRAFYESLYTIQKFAQGIRDDIIGGSEFVDEQNTWDKVKEKLESPGKAIGSAALQDILAHKEV